VFGKIETLPSGRYRASYIFPPGPTGVRHFAPTTFDTVTDADAWLAVERARIVAGDWTPSSITEKHDQQAARAETLAAYGARWIDERLSSKGLPLRESTKYGYHKSLGHDLADLANLPLASITPSAVSAWYRARVRSGKVTSASHGYTLLRSIMADATAKGGPLAGQENPCQIKGANSARTGRETVPPTNADLAIIVANTPPRFQAMVVVAAWAALRFGEITELRRGDIDDDGQQIIVKVRRGVTHTPTAGFIVGPPKTSRAKRDVILPPGASAILREHLARFVAADEDALLFPAASGGHLHLATHSHWWKKARAAAGRPDLPWHGLRHFGLTAYARTGATIAELMAQAGHTTAQVAMRYQHGAEEERRRDLARRMELPQITTG
jgi:integrase